MLAALLRRGSVQSALKNDLDVARMERLAAQARAESAVRAVADKVTQTCPELSVELASLVAEGFMLLARAVN